MLNTVRASLVMLISFTVLLGFIYPGIITVISDVAMPHQADGSQIVSGNKTIGSSLIGQNFSKPEYFWGRLSATGPVPYNATASSGSNLAAAAPNLEQTVKGRVEALKAADPDNKALVPVDLATSSGSGLDPHISPEAAEYQIQRIAKVRDMDTGQLKELIASHTEKRQFGFLGEPRVNVLELNIALDKIAKK